MFQVICFAIAIYAIGLFCFWLADAIRELKKYGAYKDHDDFSGE